MSDGSDPGDETPEKAWRELALKFYPEDETREVEILKAAFDNAIVSAIKTDVVLCPVCGVAWGMDCGRTNCGLSETGGRTPRS